MDRPHCECDGYVCDRHDEANVDRLERELAAAEALLQAKVLAGSGAYHHRINTEIEDYFRKKGTK